MHRKVFRRSMVAFGLAATMLVGGCRGSKVGNDKNENQGEKVLTIMVEAGGPSESVTREIAEEFTKETGCEVKIDAVPRSGFYEKITTELMSGKLQHDIADIDVAWFAAIKDGCLPINDVATDDVKEDALDGIMDPITIENDVYGLPLWTNGEILFYRKDLLENEENKKQFEEKYGYELVAPSNWKQFLDVSEFFTTDDMYGTTMVAQQHDATVTRLLEFALQAGADGPILGADGKVNIDSKPYKDSLNFMKEQFTKGYVPQDALSMIPAQANEIFANGKSAIHLAWAHTYTDYVKALGEENVGVGPMISGSKGIASMTGPWYEVILKNSPNTELAKEFLKFKWENNRKFMEASFKVCANKSVMKEYYGRSGYEHLEPLVTTLTSEQTIPRPALTKWTQISDILSKMTQQVLLGEEIEPLLSDAQKQIEELVD